MTKNSTKPTYSEKNLQNKCFMCNYKIVNNKTKYCPNCKVIINPNDLKWRKSFIIFLILLFLFPAITVLIVLIKAK